MSRKVSILVISLFCIVSLVSIVLLLTANDTVFAQEWSSSQKEVWKNVETYWKLSVDRDLEAWSGYYHPDFLGWNYEDNLPADKASRTKFSIHFLQTTKDLVYEVKPVGIKIHRVRLDKGHVFTVNFTPQLQR